MIELRNIHKSFGNTNVLDDITFSIEAGEIVGFLGPNGAGKTTTMRIMTGYYSPDSGVVNVLGHSMYEDPISAQISIGYLPENNPLYSDMLVSEQLDFSADVKCIPQSLRHDSIAFAVHSVGIEHVYHKPIRELSKGYRQRVGIAQALLHKPKILILDEPSEGLDPNQRTEIRTLIKSLAQKHTVVMSTHVMQEVEAVCTRILIINGGKVIADGSAKEIMKLGGNARHIYLDIEGKKIEELLRSLDSIEDIDVIKKKVQRYSIKITVSKNALVQPEISKLAAKHGWILWGLHEEERQLEDVFHTLTSVVT